MRSRHERTSTRVGFVGLGSIGGPMALRLAGSAHDLTVLDLDPGPVAELVAAGASAADDVAALASAVDVVCVMVRDDDQVRAVVGLVAGATMVDPRGPAFAGPGPVVVIHSTVAPRTPVELAAAHPGLDVLDAPVSGGPTGAAEGSLAILVGGAPAAVERARPVLESLGSVVVHAGPLGAGTQLKLARNLIHFVSFTAATEAQRLAEAAGLDLEVLGEVVRHTDAITGGPGAIMHRDSTAPLEPTDFWHGVFAPVRALGEKDLGFAIDLADELGVDVPLARLALERLGPGLGLEEHR